jgi:hypothetical protein
LFQGVSHDLNHSSEKRHGIQALACRIRTLEDGFGKLKPGSTVKNEKVSDKRSSNVASYTYRDGSSHDNANPNQKLFRQDCEKEQS